MGVLEKSALCGTQPLQHLHPDTCRVIRPCSCMRVVGLACYLLLMRGAVQEDSGVDASLQLLSCYLAAIIHDYEHRYSLAGAITGA